MMLSAFAAKYPPAAPRIAAANPDQSRLLTANDGVLALLAPPALTLVSGYPTALEARHLWVFWGPDIPYIHELAPNVLQPLQSGVAKHTNLTGGAPASCGGELWVEPLNPSKLYVNGASGRYGPQTPEQLDDSVAVFRAKGFTVESFGWDYDTDRPARDYRP